MQSRSGPVAYSPMLDGSCRYTSLHPSWIDICRNALSLFLPHPFSVSLSLLLALHSDVDQSRSRRSGRRNQRLAQTCVPCCCTCDGYQFLEEDFNYTSPASDRTYFTFISAVGAKITLYGTAAFSRIPRVTLSSREVGSGGAAVRLFRDELSPLPAEFSLTDTSEPRGTRGAAKNFRGRIFAVG